MKFFTNLLIIYYVGLYKTFIYLSKNIRYLILLVQFTKKAKHISMKKLYYLIAVVIITATFAACTADTITIPTNVRLNYYSATMVPGESLTLTADIMPDEAVIKTLTWHSTDTLVAIVANGVVTAIAEGSAFITVTTNSGQKSATCRLTVAYSVAGVTLDTNLSVLPVGKSQKLTATVLPEYAPDRSVRWESSAPNVAEVNDAGEVIAKMPGTALISVITAVGHRIATCVIKVPSENHISMMWQPYENHSIFIAGSGTAEIDWGDGSANETITLSALGLHYSHSYSEQIPCIVIINGNDITHLNSSSRRLINLDVSANPALIELICSYNQLTSLDVNKNTALRSLYCNNNQLSEHALNNLFGTLRSGDPIGSIYIYGNPGAYTCNRSIATNKGWRVY